MSFAAPIILSLLLPWLAVTIWLMSRRGRDVEFPFVHFWPNEPPQVGKSRRLAMLPAWVIAMLLAALLAIVAAGRPLIGARTERPVVLIVDCGITMAASSDGRSQLAAAVESLIESSINSDIQPRRIMAVPRQENDHVAETDWRSAIRALRPQLLQTRDALRAAIDDALRSTDLPVVVITDQSLDDNARVIPLPPPGSVRNIGITHIAAAGRQVMVRVRNQSVAAENMKVTARSGDAIATDDLELTAGQERDVFLQLPTFGQFVAVQLDAADDFMADNFAWLARGRSWPKLEPRGQVPTAISRMVDTYAAHRATDDGSLAVALTTNIAELPNVPAVAVIGDGVRFEGNAGRGSIEVAGQIGRHIDWSAALSDALIGEEPGNGWTPLVRIGGKTIVAERALPARQVLVNFWSERFAADAGFVVLFTDIFDSFAIGTDEWQSESIRSPGSGSTLITERVFDGEPSPGVYRVDSGQLIALNAIDVTFAAQRDASPSWQRRLQELGALQAGGRDLASIGLFAAFLCFAGGLSMLARLGRTHAAS